MIYLDTSVALAQLLAEDRQPPESLWQQPLVSSRLLEYELWTRLNARDLGVSHGEAARRLVERLAILELVPDVLARAGRDRGPDDTLHVRAHRRHLGIHPSLGLRGDEALDDAGRHGHRRHPGHADGRAFPRG